MLGVADRSDAFAAGLSCSRTVTSKPLGVMPLQAEEPSARLGCQLA